MPVRDLSSGYRLYRREVLRELELTSTNFEVQEEILVKAYASGFSVVEVPFTYFPRGAGRSHAQADQLRLEDIPIRVAVVENPQLARVRRLRRARLLQPDSAAALLAAPPPSHRRAVGARRGPRARRGMRFEPDRAEPQQRRSAWISTIAKLRFLRRYEIPLVNASAFALPFKDDSFDCVISSQVIEHIRYDESLFSEMRRVLRTGGMLILGTPDYATLGWRIIEPIYGFLMPGGYKDEHITHYTLAPAPRNPRPLRNRDRGDRLRRAQRADPQMPQGRSRDSHRHRHRRGCVDGSLNAESR